MPTPKSMAIRQSILERYKKGVRVSKSLLGIFFDREKSEHLHILVVHQTN